MTMAARMTTSVSRSLTPPSRARVVGDAACVAGADAGSVGYAAIDYTRFPTLAQDGLLLDCGELGAQLAMHGRSAAGELPGLADRQARVGKWQQLDGGGGIARESIASFDEGHVDTGAAQDLEIAIKAAHVEAEGAHEAGARLRAPAQECHLAKQSLRSFGGNVEGGCGTGLLRHDSLLLFSANRTGRW